MRNGNVCQSLLLEGLSAGSYRTYEEWKRLEFVRKLFKFLVLTVPMRNGNTKR